MSERLRVYQNELPIYDIILADSFQDLGIEISKHIKTEKKMCIVTDSHVESLYGEEVREILNSRCSQLHTFVFPEGEVNKNLDTVCKLYEYLICNHYDRGDMLVALGGGVVGDLCGYAAATYLRGVGFIQIPTTLLSQVDSSIGGKTGVDFDSYKNMVGAFHMPRLVFTNIRTLCTLDDPQFASGMGEIIKHGLIQDYEYYEWISHHAQLILERDMRTCEEMILRSDQIKKAVVERDPKEQGDRALLNFGHTLGHAIEKQMNFQMLHGHCVALGALGSAYISAKRALISMEDVTNMKKLFQAFHLPTKLSNASFDLNTIVAATKNDKKMESGFIKFILLRRMGEAYVDCSVTDQEMLEALTWLTGDTDEA